ncbi:uncharacterized protein LOC114278339 [Camellia sinensis]|uniref:uncharacterized protein LOC114278339 n=1 Tax=Camellia sinensis TaxID=4442 RepID=UPI001035F78F|nr:uncharacterized protein LOC114278339 [Camellia sinensis]
MHITFSMKELGFVNYFLGISVTKTAAGYVLSQQKYASDLLAKASMSDWKTYSSLMATKSSSSALPAAVKRLLRYLKGTLSYGLHFTPGPLLLNAYSDSDWVGNVLDRRSTTGYCVYLGPNLISWSAKKQPTVSRSSSEAEYRALAQTSAELSWIGMLLADLHISVPVPIL